MNDRPYFHYKFKQLEAEFEKQRSNLPVVRAIRAELEHRTTAWAAKLLKKIDAHLKGQTGTSLFHPIPKPEYEPNVSKVARPAERGSMRYFGIDLGTSTCSVCYAVDSARPNVVPQPVEVRFRVDPLQDIKSAVVPSVVVSTSKGISNRETLVGFEAENALRNNQVRGANDLVFRSMKSHLGTARSYVRAVPALNTPVKVWAALIRRLCEMTIDAKGADFDPRNNPTVLTVPASFNKAQRDETIEAARLAGFNVSKEANLVHLIDEPVAALIDYLNHADCDLHIDPGKWNTVLVFDFGGGTCDLVALKFRYDKEKPTGIAVEPQAISDYCQIGGDTIDLAIMEQVVWPQLCQHHGLDRQQLSATERRAIEEQLRYDVGRRLKEHLNDRITSLGEERRRRHDWDGIVRTHPIGGNCHLGGKELTGDVRMTADDLHRVMVPFIDPDPLSAPFRIGEASICVCLAKLVDHTLARAGLTQDRLDVVVLHGGSCKSPLVRDLFRQMKESGVLAPSCKIVQSPDLSTSVARGAALYGCLSAKHGKPYIAPIVPEDMWIQTVGGDFECMVSAGQQLPFRKTFAKEFFLASANQCEITVPIYIGYEAPERRLASTLVFELKQRNLDQSHPVEAELEIDIDKISRWRFRPKGYDWSDAKQIENPWIEQEQSEETSKLLKIRTSIRSSIDKGTHPSVQTLMEEALNAARAGYSEEALGLIEDVIRGAERNGSAFNIKAMIHAQRGEHSLSIQCYDRACSLNPTNMVFRGNLGTALVRSGRHQEAVVVMREALSKDPSLTYLHSWLAEAFQALQNTGEMNKELEMCLAHAQREAIRCPEDVTAWEEVRSAALRIGRYDEAEEARKTIHELTRPRNLLAGARHG